MLATVKTALLTAMCRVSIVVVESFKGETETF
jgi:hypothetical protein